MLGFGSTLGKKAISSGLKYVKDNLKIYFDFNSNKAKKLNFLGEGSCFNSGNQSDFIEVPSTNFQFGTDTSFTVMFWFRSIDTAARTFISQNSSHDNGGWSITYSGTGRINFSVEDSGGAVSNFQDSGGTTTAISDGKWHHLAVVFDRPNLNRLIYLDGVEDRTRACAGLGSMNNAHPLILFNNYQNGTKNNGFYGNYKNVGIWKRKLTVNEIINIMYKRYEELKSSELTRLQGWYPLESNANDSTGNQNGAATFSSSTSFTSSLYGEHTPAKPRAFDNAPEAQADLIGSGSASFDGSDDYITMGDVLDRGTTDFSVVFWVKITAGGPSGHQGLIAKKADLNAGTVGWSIQFNHDGSGVYRLYSYLDDGGGVKGMYGAVDSFEVEKWYHIAVVYDRDGNLSQYIDGEIDSTPIDISSDTDTITNTSDFIIGKQLAQEEFAGNIAQVGVFNAVLTIEQIQSIKEKSYSELTTDEKEDLVSWWGLDQTALSSEIGVGTFQNNGTWIANLILDNNDETTTSIALNGNESDLAGSTSGTTGHTTVTDTNLVEGATYKLQYVYTNTNNAGYFKWRTLHSGGTTNDIVNHDPDSSSGPGVTTVYFTAPASHPLNAQYGGGPPWEGTIRYISLVKYDGNPGALK